MNVHHLELFYHVARHGGVSAAARHMPYGIQQPAISAQILQLEDSLGVTLFQRRPFNLTKEGESLFKFIDPFFSGLPRMSDQMRGGAENRLRIATPEIVQREYLPVLLRRTKERVKGFHFELSTGRVEDIENDLKEQRIDLGLAVLTGKRSEGVRHRELLRLPMSLLVQEKSRVTNAADILGRDRIDLPLITLPGGEPVCRMFQAELQKRKVDWFPTHELSNLDLITRYVAEGFGVGLMLAAPSAALPRGVRSLALEGFPDVSFGALWSGRLSQIGEIFVEEAAALAQKISNGSRAAD